MKIQYVMSRTLIQISSSISPTAPPSDNGELCNPPGRCA